MLLREHLVFVATQKLSYSQTRRGTTCRVGAIERVLHRGGDGQDSVRVVPEPENLHDRVAVRVQIDGEHVGYIPRGKAPPLHVTLTACGSQEGPNKMGGTRADMVGGQTTLTHIYQDVACREKEGHSGLEPCAPLRVFVVSMCEVTWCSKSLAETGNI